MLKLDLNRLFKVKAIQKKGVFLKKNGFTKGQAYQLANRNTISITIKSLERLCRIFNCTPSDLFTYVPDKQSPLPSEHSLNSLIRPETQDINTILKDFPPDKITHILSEIEKLKNNKC